MLNHMILTVSDVERSLAFYERRACLNHTDHGPYAAEQMENARMPGKQVRRPLLIDVTSFR